MTERRVRQPLTIRAPEALVSQSQKRKSSDGESENVSPNVASKKAKSKTTFDTTDDSALKIAMDPKCKSKMPVYNKGSTQKSTSTPGKTKKGGNGMISTPSTSSKGGPSRPQTPRTLPKGVSEAQIESYFNGGLPFTEKNIEDIMQPLILGGKGKKHQTLSNTELKDKLKLYSTVIKELKEVGKKVIFEYNKCRDKSVAYERVLRTKEKDLIAELEEFQEQFEESQNKCNQLKEYLIKANATNFSMTEQARLLKEEHSPMRHRKLEIETLYEEASASLKEEKHFSGLKDVKIVSLEVNSQLQLKQMDEQRAKSVEEMELKQKEVANLTLELGRWQSDVERNGSEKTEMGLRTAELKEELEKSKAIVLLSETALKQKEIDLTRLEGDVERSARQLEKKDDDLRNMNSAFNQERMDSRTDYSALQSRITLLEQERLETTSQLAAKREECLSTGRELARHSDDIINLQSKLTERETEMGPGQQAIKDLEVKSKLLEIAECRENAERTERIACSANAQAVQLQCSHQLEEMRQKYDAQMDTLRLEIQDKNSAKELAIEEMRVQSDKAILLNTEVQELKLALEHTSISPKTVEELAKVKGECEVLKRRMKDMSDTKDDEGSALSEEVRRLSDLNRNGELQRRKLHNLVQELRGNVRVFARVRPFLPSDGIDLKIEPAPVPSIAVKSDDVSLRIFKAGGDDCKASATGTNKGEDHSFTFDRSFGPSSSQESVFSEVSEFVQSALDGYNVCLFSYGQTGSGKTHTMAGSGHGNMRGIIPRAIQQVGTYKTELEGKGWVYHMEVSFIEIYNETIRDLLRVDGGEESKHEIKKDAQNNLFVSDVTMVPVDPNDGPQMDAIMELAARHRSVEKTAMNERSSRSHSIFTLHLHATSAQGVVLRGVLSLVDLAGSERLDRSQASGARAKETVAINKSLSSLVDVFSAISHKAAHIPFRNSKLTYLLSQALSGDGKTLMMVNLSPTEESYFESLCSLRFASNVNQCELGKPKKQVKEAADPEASPSIGIKRSASPPSAKRPISSKGLPIPPSSSSKLPPATPSSLKATSSRGANTLSKRL